MFASRVLNLSLSADRKARYGCARRIAPGIRERNPASASIRPGCPPGPCCTEPGIKARRPASGPLLASSAATTSRIVHRREASEAGPSALGLPKSDYDASTFTPFQNATRPLIRLAAGFGSG
jgi:hypothetical protein